MSAADAPDDRVADAGEYVLGTLDDAERAAFERAMAADPVLRAEVARWQDRLVGLAGRAAPARPSAQTWVAIERRLGAQGDAPGTQATSIGAGASTASGTASGATPAAPPADRGAEVIDLRRRLRRWQLGGGLALAASAVLATLGVLRAPAPGAAVRHVAVLEPQQAGGGRWLVEVDERGALRLAPLDARVEVAADRTLELWTHPPAIATPTSLGVVPAGRETRLAPGRLAAVVEPGTVFALSLEPAGGSPTGAPTGPVLYVGKTTRL